MSSNSGGDVNPPSVGDDTVVPGRIPPADVRHRTLGGLRWTATSALLQQVVQFGFSVVLARILVPEDFGLMALMSVFTGFASLFVDFGIGAAIIQRPDLKQRHLNSALWLNVGSGTLFMVTMIAAAPALAAFYNEPQLTLITMAFAPAFLIGSLTGVQGALLQRTMSFRALAVIENVAFVGGNVIGIATAIAGFGVWSLVALTLATGIIKVALLWLTNDWRPTGPPDRRSIRDLWGFSSRLAGFTAVNYWARNADNLLIGRFIGTNQLAYYNRAYNLMSMPLDMVSSVATRVMYPALSNLQGDRLQVKRVYLRALGMIAIVMFPVIVGLAVLSTPFIVSVYGAKWEPSAQLLQILCVAGLLQTLARTSGWIFQSQGRTDWLFRWGIVATITVICAFFIGLPWGTKGVAIAYSCWTVLAMPILFSVSGRLIGATLGDMARSVSGVSLAALVMGVVTWFANDRLPGGWSPLVHLVVGVGIGSLTYAVALHFISPAPYHECRQLLDRYRSRILRPTRAIP